MENPSTKATKATKAEIHGEDLMAKIVSLTKRRGFVFQSSEIYGGLKSCYDYGPLGVELKRNIAGEWWRRMVHEREDVVGLDASIIMHPAVWRASGHVEGFSDPLVECLNCHVRFRSDKVPRVAAGTPVTYRAHATGKEVAGQVDARGYACPDCNSPLLSEERKFNLMFKTNLGPVESEENIVYLRPETAQAMFVNFANVQQSSRLKVPFGIAQIGKSFRNEITVKHFIFRSCEFEQMEMEFFVEPGSDDRWLDYWKDERLRWWTDLGIAPDHLRLRAHTPEERAHYAKACFDVEYLFPWGWDELEGIANRTDYDLKRHQEESGKKLEYVDANRPDPATGKPPLRFLPYVIEPAAGATRALLAVLLDAYDEEPPSEAREEGRVVLRLSPRLAPVKCAVFPLVKKDDDLTSRARAIVREFWKSGINSVYDEKDAIGRRYARQDEIGTPFCITVDGQTKTDDTVTLRYRDDMRQERIRVADAVAVVREKILG